ncbi:MAG: DegT/DnrJ/EryC1/StrS family aminotransferase [Candidatus Cloacimonetes bacterium]|nr:DegT/DnrJ/EryC1/StrS family aminotransferase [Candidatus Cloacimonadota bacterium]
MKIPFVDLKSNFDQIKKEYLIRVDQILNDTSFIDGYYNRSFEDKFASLHDSKFGVSLSSGTAGNHMALRALNIGVGDEVILPANTFIATAWGITLCGATPVFVDVDPETFNIDSKQVEEKITSNTKAIIAVHLYGLPAKMDALLRVGKKYGIPIIEDAAQAHLAEFDSQKVGSFGKLSSFSFYPSKNLGAFGEAGAITTNSEELTLKIRKIINQGSESKYVHSELGTNYRLSHLIAASLDLKIPYLQEWTEARIRIANRYQNNLKDISNINFQKVPSNCKAVYHLFVVQTQNRSDLQKHLNEKGISTGIHYPIPIHLQSIFNGKQGDCPIAEKLAQQTLSLPIYPNLTDSEVDYVCDRIRDFSMNKNIEV